MLHVAFGELPRGGCKYMFAGELRGGINERHTILELVAKAKRSARLIQSGSSPEPATQRLIQEPAVQQKIDGQNRRFHLQPAQRSIPPLEGCVERFFHGFGRPQAHDDGPDSFDALRLAQQKDYLCLLASFERDNDLLRCAGVRSGAESIVETGAAETRRIRS